MGKRKTRSKPSGRSGKSLILVILALLIAFIIAGFVKIDRHTALQKLDRLTGMSFLQPTHNTAIGWVRKLYNRTPDLDEIKDKISDDKNRVIKETRPSGKVIQRLEKLDNPLDNLTKEDQDDLDRLLEEKTKGK